MGFLKSSFYTVDEKLYSGYLFYFIAFSTDIAQFIEFIFL